MKICSKSTGEHSCLSVISVKLQSNFTGFSPVNLLHTFKTRFPRNTSGRLLLSKWFPIFLLHLVVTSTWFFLKSFCKFFFFFPICGQLQFLKTDFNHPFINQKQYFLVILLPYQFKQYKNLLIFITSKNQAAQVFFSFSFGPDEKKKRCREWNIVFLSWSLWLFLSANVKVSARSSLDINGWKSLIWIMMSLLLFICSCYCLSFFCWLRCNRLWRFILVYSKIILLIRQS